MRAHARVCVCVCAFIYTCVRICLWRIFVHRLPQCYLQEHYIRLKCVET